jgi:copper chaperone CopZ
MRPRLLVFAPVMASMGLGAIAVDVSAASAVDAIPIKATYSISGLHCPPCAHTVESSLKKLKGVELVKVDWNTKAAKVEFDESVLPAQQVASAIAKTPHMMGGGMQYGGWLALKVPELNEEGATAAKEALAKVAGVKNVAVYPKQKMVSVQFAPGGSTTSADLIAALGTAGLKAETF